MGDNSKVGDFVTLRRGTTYKGSLVGQPGPALLGLGSIVPGGGFRDDYKTYGGECPPELMLVPGDLYVSLKGATKDGQMIGSVARVPSTVQSGRLTQDTVRLVFRDRDAAFERYLYWLLRTPDYRSYCAGRAMGSAVVALSRDDFLSYPVPQLTTPRRRVVEVLENIEDKVESCRRAIELAERLADAIFIDMADGYVGLATVAEIIMGSSPPGTSYNEEGDGTPFYQGVRDFGRRYPNHRVWTTAPVRLAQDNDTLVSVRAPVGELNRAWEKCCVGRGLAAIRSTTPSAIFYALRAAEAVWEPFQHEGTVFGAINKTDLARAKVPWPEASQITKIETCLAAIDEKIRSLSAEISHLQNLRDTLLPGLLSGSIHVPGANEAA